MTLFQKILIAIPITIYVGLICSLSWIGISQGNFSIVAFMLGLIFLTFIVLIPTIFIRVVFFNRISDTGSIIIALWLPVLIVLCWLFWSYLDMEVKRKTYDSYATNQNWQFQYEGPKQSVLIAAQKFAEDTLLRGFDFKKYFAAVQQLPADTSKFEIYYFYADQNHPDTSSMMVVRMTSDSIGHILSYEKECTYDSTRLKEIYYSNMRYIDQASNIIDSLKAEKGK